MKRENMETFYTVKYWMKDILCTAVFKDMEKARKFQQENSTFKVTTHNLSNPERVKYFEYIYGKQLLRNLSNS
jgi:hypothetical protein